MRRVVAIAAFVLAACARDASQQAAATSLPVCGEEPASGALVDNECRLQAAGQTLHVRYAALAAGTTAGNVSVDILGDDGAPVQTLLESDVPQYLPPSVQDVDGDGRADILIRRETGNVNSVIGVWIFNGERGRYERVGTVSGVEITRTEEGYIAVPARSSAAGWSVAFYKLDEGGLIPMVTVDVDADVGEDGAVRRVTCRIADAPGLADLNLGATEAETKFCAERAAAEVFAP